MAKNLSPTDCEIRAKTMVCEERFNACLANPRLRAHQWLETGYAEFNLWSFGLKASRSDRSSLDYKVRQRADLREIIVDLLDGLDESLTQCLDLELVEQIHDDSASNLSPEKISHSPHYFHVFNIKKILNQLTKLYIAIRKSGTQLRHHQADTSFKSMLRNNVNRLEEFRSDMVEAVLAGLENWKPEDGLPKPWGNANIQLLERLAKANARRRNRIFFATEKIGKCKIPHLEKDERPAMVVRPILGSDAGEETAKPERKPEGLSSRGESTKESPASLQSQGENLSKLSEAPTTATTIPLDAITEQPPSKVAGTTITKATGTAQKEAYIYPSPPQWPENSKDSHIDCPYCSEPLAKKHKIHEVWSGHVSGDILPYICFLEDCKFPDDLYRTSKELTNHVVSEHGIPCWICDICTPDIEQEQFGIFQTAQLWREHMCRAHSQVISDTDFSKLADLAMHKMVPPLKCPLCDYATLEIKPNIDPEITRHILRFSMRSLPWEVQAEANLSKERLKGRDSSASASNSSSDRRHTESNTYLPDPNYEEMEPTDHKKLQLNNLTIFRQITASHQNHHNFYLSRGINFSLYEEDFEDLDKPSCELLLPILIQLRYSMEEVLAFESYGNELDKDQTYEPSLKSQLSANFCEIFDRMRSLLDTASADFKEGSALVKTKCGTDDYIQQWRGLLDNEFIPGDPDYVPQDENEDPAPTVRPITKRTTTLKSRDDYTVGWICALPEEQRAAFVMLDERHADIRTAVYDHNTYNLGSIGRHNVVIASPPYGRHNSSSPELVGYRMIESFPRIKFGLMVGIGSGVPSKVRLGDVVVSTPTGYFPGAVQWAMVGKESGSFRRLGSLNNPPNLLLTTLTKLMADPETGDNMLEHLEEIREKWPNAPIPNYSRPKSLKDVVFKSQYLHVEMTRAYDEEGDEEDEQDECKFCDKNMVVKREPWGERVHYGLIASGNEIIRDATLREQINKDFGGQIYCIDNNTGAQLMNSLPSIVIRGICDYADSHKYQRWRHHAAGMAAAFAKELLHNVLPVEERDYLIR